MKRHLEQKKFSNGAVGRTDLVVDDIGLCVLCGSKSVCKCQRCGDFYCSPQCQRKDWPNHRYICFPMPCLVKASNWSPAKENEEKMSVLQCEIHEKNVAQEEKQEDSKAIHPGRTKIPASESCVLLTSFKSTNRCYVRSTNPSEEENYKKILKEIDEFGKTAPALTGKPKSNSYALAPRNGKWCRVQIFGNLTERRFRVQFVDYGGIVKRRQNELRQINNHLISLPCYVHMVQLKDINVVSISTSFINALLKYTNEEYKLVLEREGAEAKLFNWKTKALLNTEIDNLLCKLTAEGKNTEADVASIASFLSNEAEHENDVEKSISNKPSQQNNENINKAISPKTGKTESKNENNYSPRRPSIITQNYASQQNNENINKAISPKTGKTESKNENNYSPKRPSIITQKKAMQQSRESQAPKPCLEPPFKICPLNENDKNCKIIITDDSFAEVGYIGCLLENYCENLKAVTTFLRGHRINDQPYKPKLNEYCLAEFENEWYRAKVMEIISEDKYRVVYIDFTNEMELTSKSIRPYPMSLTVPCHTTLCAIDGLPEVISGKLKDFLKSECAAFKELYIDNVRIEDDVSYVESKELSKKLHDNKLI